MMVSFCFPIVFYGVLMFSVSFPMVFFMVFPCFSYGLPAAFLWCSGGFPVVLLRFSYGLPVAFSWSSLFSDDVLMLFRWFSHDFAMVFGMFLAFQPLNFLKCGFLT